MFSVECSWNSSICWQFNWFLNGIVKSIKYFSYDVEFITDEYMVGQLIPNSKIFRGQLNLGLYELKDIDSAYRVYSFPVLYIQWQ